MTYIALLLWQDRDMKALVTGATGFVGSHITRQLIDAGHSVRALYRSENKLRQLAGLELEAVPGDLDDSARLERACAGCELVFHVAAKADYWKDDDRDALWRVNVEGTRNLLAAALGRRCPPRRLHQQRFHNRHSARRPNRRRDDALQPAAGALLVRLH